MRKEQLTMDAKVQITRQAANGYAKLCKAEKGKVLDQLCQTNGWTRKHAIGELEKVRSGKVPPPSRRSKKKQTRSRKYGKDLYPIIKRLWELSRYQNSKSLHALLGLWLDKAEKVKAIKTVTAEQRKLITGMSEATLDRMLKPARDELKIKGKSTTKPSPLLRNSIKVRKAGDEAEQAPGFTELDTVAHCGGSLKGEFARTITQTDVFTGWTENAAIRNNAHSNIKVGLNHLEKQFPFKITGFDTDNGSEFINEGVIKWVNARDLYFTRSRPYKKNDNAHAEQKNNDIVRRLAFYLRYDTKEEREILNKLYKLSSEFFNFFRAIQKANGYREDKIGRRVRTYDAPKTPMQRVIDSGILSAEEEARLLKKMRHLDPIGIGNQITILQIKLLDMAKAKNSPEEEEALLLDLIEKFAA